MAAADSELRPVASETLAAIHTKETLPFLAGLLFDNDPEVQVPGVYGISALANGCPVKTRRSVVTMQHLVCEQPSANKTAPAAGKFVFRRGTADQQIEQVLFWRKWVQKNPDLQ